MAPVPWKQEPLELFDARQALQSGSYAEATAALGRMLQAYRTAEDVIFMHLDIFNAQGDLLELQKAATRFLRDASQPSQPVTQLLRLVEARCKMMIDMAFSDYLNVAIGAWEANIKDSDLESCDKATVSYG